MFLLATVISKAVAGPSRHGARSHPRRNTEPIVIERAIDKRAAVAWGPGGWGKSTVTIATPPSITSTSSTTASKTSAPAPSSATISSPSATESSGTGGGTSTSTQLSSADSDRITSLGFQAGTNAQDSSGDVWIGSGGAYTSEFVNNFGDDIILVVWGPDASWVIAHTPLITLSLPAQGSTQISFAYQQVGAWSAVYPDTPLVSGQIANTWAEYTFNSSGVVDVSRLVNDTVYDVEIVGPSCTSNMDTCVFKCDSGNSCTTGYTLVNCRSQSGSQDGTDNSGADSGGYGWNGAISASFKTTFGALSSS